MKTACSFTRSASALAVLRRVFAALILFFMVLCGAGQGSAQSTQPDKGVHSRYGIYVPSTDFSRGPGKDVSAQPADWLAARPENQFLAVAAGDVDTSVLKNLRQAYGIPEERGTGIIAIVVAYHHPSAAEELQEFSRVFSLPQCGSEPCLEVLPPHNTLMNATDYCDWAEETEIGLQWAHAIAPKAKLLLVEAETGHASDLFAATQKAKQRLLALGGGQVIMAWGFPEGTDEEEVSLAMEQQYDAIFSDGVIYFAASGDTPQIVAYPAASARVIGVGGTQPAYDETGKLIEEVGWPQSGGGPSQYIAKPAFQNGVENTSPRFRSTPDLAMSANDVPVYGTGRCLGLIKPWHFRSGTSVSVVLAGAMANAAGSRNHSTATELKNIYSNRRNAKQIRDIVSVPGTNCCAAGYNTYTGVGVPAGLDFDAP